MTFNKSPPVDKRLEGSEMTSVFFKIPENSTLLKQIPDENMPSDDVSIYAISVGLFQIFYKVTVIPELNNSNSNKNNKK